VFRQKTGLTQATKDLLARQYWTASPLPPKELLTESEILGSHGFPLYGPADNGRYIKEPNLLREILFMLTGVSGSVFTANPPVFEVRREVLLPQFSESTMARLLAAFCEHGNSLLRTRKLLEDLQKLARERALTLVEEAFTQGMFEVVTAFEKRLNEMELKYSLKAPASSQQDVPLTLFSLLHDLYPDLELVSQVGHLAASHFSSPRQLDAPAATSSTTLLTLLWIEAVELHTLRHPSFPVVLRLFLLCCQPYFRLLGDWMREGHLHDAGREFFVLGDPHLKVSSLQHWRAGFRLQERVTKEGVTIPSLPDFLLPHAQDILQIGKAVQVLRHFDQTVAHVTRAPPADSAGTFADWLFIIAQGASVPGKDAGSPLHPAPSDYPALSPGGLEAPPPPDLPPVEEDVAHSVETAELAPSPGDIFTGLDRDAMAKSLLAPRQLRTLFGEPYPLLGLQSSLVFPRGEDEAAIMTQLDQVVALLSASSIPLSIQLTHSISLLLGRQHTGLAQTLYDIFVTKSRLLETLEWIRIVFFMERGQLAHDFARLVFDKVYEGEPVTSSHSLDVAFQELLVGSAPSHLPAPRMSVALRGQTQSTLDDSGEVIISREDSWQQIGDANSNSGIQSDGEGGQGSDPFGPVTQITVRLDSGWPLSILISEPLLADANMIFQLLLKIKFAKHHLDRLLLDVPTAHGTGKQLLHKFLVSRHDLSQFVETLLSHMVFDIIQPLTTEFQGQLRKVIGTTDATITDLDTLVEVLQSHFARVRDQLLLGTQSLPLMNTITKMLELCVGFVHLFLDNRALLLETAGPLQSSAALAVYHRLSDLTTEFRSCHRFLRTSLAYMVKTQAYDFCKRLCAPFYLIFFEVLMMFVFVFLSSGTLGGLAFGFGGSLTTLRMFPLSLSLPLSCIPL